MTEECLQRKFCLVMKSFSTGPAALTDTIFKFGGAAIRMQWLKERIRDSLVFHAFCAPSKQKLLAPFLSAENATSAVYLDMFKKVIVWSDFGGRYALPARENASIFTLEFRRDFLNRNFLWTWVGTGGPITLPGRYPDPTPLVSFFCKYVMAAVYVPRAATTLSELAGRIWTYTRHAYKCVQRTWIQMWNAWGLFTVPSLNICEPLSEGRKNVMLEPTKIHLVSFPLLPTSWALLH
jgi:hypothetical protein